MLDQDDPNTMRYTASKTVREFMACQARWRLIMGPFGSGKSVGCTVEMLKWAMEQEPCFDGIRRTRFAVIRNSYRELKDTTRKTVEDWIPKNIYTFSEQDFTMYIKFNDVECEILFRALDTPDDVKKLLSLELTAAWINEAREIPKQVFKMLKPRVGRYPSKRSVPPTAANPEGGCTKFGIWMDTNPPDTDHWMYNTFEEENLEDHQVFHQPSGRSPDAENIENLPKGYYQNLMVGADQNYISVYVDGEYGFVKDGKPVYPEFKHSLHVMKEHPTLKKGETLYLGMDFGLTPAIVLARKTTQQYQIIGEWVSNDMGANAFAKIITADIRRDYPGHFFRGWGDPAGTQRSQVDEQTPYDVVQAAGLPIEPASTNDFVRRREAVAGLLTRLNLSGQPWLVVSPRCKKFIKAMSGGYMFKRVQVNNEERYQDLPVKNMHSHVAEAGQYLFVGEGEDYEALGKAEDMSSSRHKMKNNIPPPRNRR